MGRVWTYHDATQTVGHSAATNALNFTSGLQTQLDRKPFDYSIRRIVGSIQVSAPAGSSAYDSAKIFMGIVPVDADATASGAYPDPFGDNVPWLWTHAGQIFVPDNPAASLSTLCIPDHVASPLLDVRQARRIKGSGDQLCLVCYDDSGITGTLNISVSARCLWDVRA